MTAPLVRQGRERSPLTAIRDRADLRSLRTVGRRYACDLCGGMFRARAANQRYCSGACLIRRRRFDAAHGPALVGLVVTFARFRKRRRGTPEHRLAMDALRDLCRRGRELRGMLDGLREDQEG